MTHVAVFVSLSVAISLASPVRSPSAALHSGHPDEILSLPGLDWEIGFRQYAGYLDLPNTKKHMFYWLVEAETNSASAPVVLWTNGGPGCSGLIGFLTEQGPFRPLQNLSLVPTEFPWNQNANMLFIEQPAGVGFSYSDDPSDYNTGDKQSAADNYLLVQEFFKRFPNFLPNDFYISAESYGGHYIPELARQLVENKSSVNFKGFLVGNPLTNMVENAHGMFDTFYGHAMIAKPTFDEWNKKCGNGETTEQCNELTNTMQQQAGNTDPYAIDYPVCNTQLRTGRKERMWLLHHLQAVHNSHVKGALHLIPPSDYQPCEEQFAISYLNQPAVKAAIHANANLTWTDCSPVLNYNQADVALDMIPNYEFLLKNGGLKMLVYSGDDDAICGTLGTERWIWNLGQSIKTPWTSWNYNDTEYGSQIGGYIVKFDGITFATVHGAGHQAPTFRPNPTHTLFSMFLDGSIF